MARHITLWGWSALSLVSIVFQVFGQPPDSLWSRTFGGSDWDYPDGECVQQTSDGGYILVGSTRSYGAGNYDFWLVKTNADGDSLWSRTFGGTQSDQCHCVRQTSDGGYILAGQTRSFGAGLY